MTFEAYAKGIDLLEISIDEYTGVNETSAMLDIEVGMKNDPQDGNELFYAYAVTPENLSIRLKNPTGIMTGRGHYLVEKIDRETLQRVADHITEKINSTQGETWQEVSRKLSWYALGEFERYDQINNRYY